jgi:hypothetical protein
MSIMPDIAILSSGHDHRGDGSRVELKAERKQPRGTSRLGGVVMLRRSVERLAVLARLRGIIPTTA